jgi:hypothetical protein
MDGTASLSFDEAKDPTNPIYNDSTLQGKGNSDDVQVPLQLKRKIIDMFRYVERCEEDKHLLEVEMKALVLFHQDQFLLLEGHLKDLVCDSDLQMGLVTLLKTKQHIHRVELF